MGQRGAGIGVLVWCCTECNTMELIVRVEWGIWDGEDGDHSQM